MINYPVVIERAGSNYSSYSPDLPGCVATGGTREEVESNMRQALEMHIQGFLEDKLPVPRVGIGVRVYLCGRVKPRALRILFKIPL